MNEGLAKFHKKYPWITVKSRRRDHGRQAHRRDPRGNPPDVRRCSRPTTSARSADRGLAVTRAATSNADQFDMNQFPKTIRYYTAYKDKRCALPFLADTYGLYYNKKLLAKAGHLRRRRRPSTSWQPTRRSSRTRNPDGSLEGGRLRPVDGFLRERPASTTAPCGARRGWTRDKSALADRPGLGRSPLAEEARRLVRLRQARQWQAGAGDEFSASNAFEKRQARDEPRRRVACRLHQGRAPGARLRRPRRCPSSKPDLYGSGFVIGTIMGIPKGAKHPDPAWLFLKYFSTDPTTLAEMSNGLAEHPVDARFAEVAGAQAATRRFKTFLNVFANPKSSTPPVLSIGAQNQTLFASFLDEVAGGAREGRRSP